MQKKTIITNIHVLKMFLTFKLILWEISVFSYYDGGKDSRHS